MTTPTSPIKFSDIQTEFGGSNPVSISEYYRGGALVNSGTAASVTDGTAISASGLIRAGMFRGVSSGPLVVNLSIAANSSTSYNIYTAAGSPTGVANVTVTVASGAVQGGTASGGATAGTAIDTGTGWADGSTITLVTGSSASAVIGGGGAGGSGATIGGAAVQGQSGGIGINLQWPVTFSGFTGTVGAGGAGGGGGGQGGNGAGGNGAGGGGGGGGAGFPGGAGGVGGSGSSSKGAGLAGATGGAFGTSSNGGVGGVGGNNTTNGTGGTGGTAGTTAVAGGSGQTTSGLIAGGGGGGGGVGQASGAGGNGGGGSLGGGAGSLGRQYAIKTNGFAYAGAPGTALGLLEGFVQIPAGNYVSTTTSPVNAVSNITFSTTGAITRSATGTQSGTSNGTWFTTGMITPMWIRWTLVSGTTPTSTPGASGTWLEINSTNRGFGNSTTAAGTVTSTIAISFSSSSSGTPIVATQNITITATRN